MQWQLYAELNPVASQEDRSGSMLEATLTRLVGLGLAPDAFARIHAALNAHLESANQPLVRVFISFEQSERFQLPRRDWRFFIVAPGSPATADHLEPRVELYLY